MSGQNQRYQWGPPRQRGGTTRYDSDGQRMDGEYDEHDRPMGSQPGNRPMGLSSPEQWAKNFPAANVGGTAAPAATPKPAWAAIPPGTAGGGAAQMAMTAAGNAKAASQPSVAGPSIGTSRQTPSGGRETLMESQSGARWVGGVSNPPPENNRNGEAAGNSLAKEQMVRERPRPAPFTSSQLTGNKATDDAAMKAQGAKIADWYDHPTEAVPNAARASSGAQWTAPGQSGAVAIAEKYGDPTGGRIQNQPTPGTVSYAGDGSKMPANVAPRWATNATHIAQGNSVAPMQSKLQSQEFAGGPDIKPPAPAGPAASPAAPSATQSAPAPAPSKSQVPPYSLSESPSTAYARQQEKAANIPTPPTAAPSWSSVPGINSGIRKLGGDIMARDTAARQAIGSAVSSVAGPVVDWAAKAANSGGGEGSRMALWLQDLQKRRLTPAPRVASSGASGAINSPKLQLGQ